jgi:hypothetical protein
MKNLLFTIIVVGASTLLGYLWCYNTTEPIYIERPCIENYEQKRIENLDKLNFEIKRQEMLDVYEGVRGFEKQYNFWDTLQFIRVEQQF